MGSPAHLSSVHEGSVKYVYAEPTGSLTWADNCLPFISQNTLKASDTVHRLWEMFRFCARRQTSGSFCLDFFTAERFEGFVCVWSVWQLLHISRLGRFGEGPNFLAVWYSPNIGVALPVLHLKFHVYLFILSVLKRFHSYTLTYTQLTLAKGMVHPGQVARHCRADVFLYCCGNCYSIKPFFL